MRHPRFELRNVKPSERFNVILEANKARYRGVSCSRCREPIPVSSKVLSLQDEGNTKETNTVQTFALRCRVCDEEGVYAVTHIQNFEGEPRTRRSRQPAVRSQAASG
jgi:hypothetical protein